MPRALVFVFAAALAAGEGALPPAAAVFATHEVALDGLPGIAALAALPDDQVHDAYDQDRDGVWVRVEASLRHEAGETLVVPAFAMRETPLGAWRWRLRWSPTRSGRWQGALRVAARLPAPLAGEADLGATVAADGGLDGPLLPPAPGGYLLQRRLSDGSSRPAWLFGACRAWNVRSDPAAAGWAAAEGLDRQRDLLPLLRGSGFDLLNQWMAPWEYLLAHRDRAEHWRAADGGWQRHPLPATVRWSAWSAFDQGRAADFDALVAACEGRPGTPTVRLLLSPVPHQALQVRSHAWGAHESGWSMEDDGGRQGAEKLNGFSAFRPAMPVWDWFAADPALPAADWRAQLFDAQANLQRHLVARWGASRALGAWVLIDELDAVGDEVGQLDRPSGWWAHPECGRWLADTVRLWRGGLRRADGLAYLGDPWRHPLHAATTSLSAGTGFGPNLAWDGGPREARVDLLGWHWYPRWPPGSTYQDVWELTVDGIAAFAARPGAKLISEFGAADRGKPDDAPSPLYPTLYHVGAWAALLAGHAGTAMDWDDGKEFGELRWRETPGAFDRERYPVDNAARLPPLRRFLAGLDPAALRPAGGRVTAAPPVRVLALAGDDGALHGWLLDRERRAVLRCRGLAPGAWRCRWLDPWTGDEVAAQAMAVGADGTAALAAPFAALPRVPAFPRDGRLDRGRDLAFHLEPARP